MKKLTVLFLLFFSLILSSNSYAYGDWHTTDDIFELYADKKTKFNILLFFNGLGSGLVWANGDLRFNGKSQLFCQPSDKGFKGEDFFRIYRQEYFRNQEIYDTLEFQPPGYLLLEGLKIEYPCN